jgi:hypothetical protein
MRDLPRQVMLLAHEINFCDVKHLNEEWNALITNFGESQVKV